MGNLITYRKSKSEESLINSVKYSKSEVENYKEYFNLIKFKLRRFYTENQHNQFNICLSLDKKDFNTITSGKKIIINPSQKYVHWKDYLLTYLQKRVNKGVLWANDLADLIKGEIFLSENKWLSLFFWQEFEMRTKPKCLNNMNNKNRKNNDTSIDSDNSDVYMESISDRLNGSLVSINTDSLSSSDPTHEYKEYRLKVKLYINIFKEHVFDTDHPINIVAKYFTNTFGAYILEVMKDLHSLHSTNPTEFNQAASIACNDITKNLQKFILKLQTALRLMYSKTINYQCFIEEKDEFINLVTNLLFKNSKLYEDVYEIFKISLYDQMKIFETKLSRLKGINPEDLGINEKFCLNTTTLNFQKKLLNDSKKVAGSEIIIEEGHIHPGASKNKFELLKKVNEQLINFKENHSDIDSIQESYDEGGRPFSIGSMKLNIKESIASHDKPHEIEEIDIDNQYHLKNSNKSININKSENNILVNTSNENSRISNLKVISESEALKTLKRSTSKTSSKIKSKYSSTCYEKAIKLLKSIKKYRIPFEKMILIATISSEITDCVNIFWKDFENVVTPSLLNIDADELMTIFIYIIIKSQCTELLIHSKFIKEFTTSTTRSTMMGYYYTTLEASIIYILSVNSDKGNFPRDKSLHPRVPLRDSYLNDQENFSSLAINNNNLFSN